MPEIIIGSPDQRMLWIGNEGQIGISGTVNINNISGTSTVIGSVIIKEVVPTDSSKNNAAGSLIYVGANIGSIVKNIGGTEYVKVLSYSGTSLVGISSWVEL